MKIHTGIFHSAKAASGASHILHEHGVTTGHIMLLTPEMGGAALHTVSPEHHAGACGVQAGHVLGAVAGFTGGLLGSAAFIFFLPGVGPILAVGTLVVSAIVGATAGATVGNVVRDTLSVLALRDPAMYQDDMYQYGFARGQEYYRAMFAYDVLGC